MHVWKLVGLAGVVSATLVGVAVGTTVVQRRGREFIDVDTDELAVRLQARLAAAQARQAG